MVGTLNKVVLIGNVGKDPEIRLTQEGKEIASFPLATSDAWKDKTSGERKEKTEWHKIVVFVPQIVEIAKNYVRKGSKLYIEGSLQTRRWLDQSNVEKYITEILLQSYNSVLMLLDSSAKVTHVQQDNSEKSHEFFSKEPAKEQKKDPKSKDGARQYEIEEIDDEIPF
ncbi:Single-stranded DNA-binding protein [Alphaproteobacteria bacterium]